MLQLLTAALTVGLPALFVFGSSRRRQLGVIREEAKTLEALAQEPPAARVMREQVLRSTVLYYVTQSRYGRGRRVAALIVLVIGYIAFLGCMALLPALQDTFPIRDALGLTEVQANRSIVALGALAALSLLVIAGIVQFAKVPDKSDLLDRLAQDPDAEVVDGAHGIV